MKARIIAKGPLDPVTYTRDYTYDFVAEDNEQDLPQSQVINCRPDEVMVKIRDKVDEYARWYLNENDVNINQEI